MRILQLIDSLEAGGAERMAINYANALSEKIAFSALVATRKEGVLKATVGNHVDYLFLKKERTLDLRAIRKLLIYCKSNNIEIIHAHSTSVFLAVLVKILKPSLKIVWHDHYGNSEFLVDRSTLSLKIILKFCAGAISVNSILLEWIQKELNFKNSIYLPNFVLEENYEKPITTLKGQSGKRIVCLANLREQKNHILLIEVAKKLKENFPNWSFHFIGKDFQDEISESVRNLITAKELEEYVFLYDSCSDVQSVLKQANIGVLSSKSEGLPVALLEYGLAGLGVVVTDVGEISKVISTNLNGILVRSGNVDDFCQALTILISDQEKRDRMGFELTKTVKAKYTKEAVLNSYLNWIRKC